MAASNDSKDLRKIMLNILKSFEKLLFNATQNGDLELVKIMMRDTFFPNKDAILSQALQIAVGNNNYALAEQFLLEGANPGSQDNSLHTALALETKDVAQLLIFHGADVNAKNDAGETALHITCLQGDIEMVQFLLKEKGERRAVNNDLQSGVFYSAMEEWSNGSILRTLLNFSDVDINAVDKDGNNLTQFRHRGPQEQQPDCHLLAVCILYGSVIKQRDSSTCTCEDYPMTEDCPALVVLAKLAALNTSLADELSSKLCIPSDSVDALRIKISEQLFDEISYAQKIVLTAKHRLTHLLTGSRNLKAKLVENINLDNVMLTCKNNFSLPMPLLGEMMQIIKIKADNRRKLYSESKELLKIIFGTRVPEIAVRLINGHLSNVELQLVIDANKYIC